MEITVVNNKSAKYPERLNRLHDLAKELHLQGAELNELLKSPVLSVVGSRKVTSYGRLVTQKLVYESARKGITIVSGLALGVDSIAHASCLEANGKTIAILPSGLKNIYPASHRTLAKNIIEKGGTLVSEYDNNATPHGGSFIQRNRIIAAMADAVLVTEAAERSGSLHTAQFALEIGIPVLAVPGNINSPTSTGTNNLLKTGAIMATSEQDIFDALKITEDTSQENLELFGDSDEETLLIRLLHSGVTNGSDLLEQSKLEIQPFQQTLSMLEIKGFVAPLGNNHWRLK